ncbi:hypothetical protein EJ110_NYTH50581 [Nymphaea thermarum]|nr:hypothetical protein EJ110_NYTH50581 [Nymphaea thermarum]
MASPSLGCSSDLSSTGSLDAVTVATKPGRETGGGGRREGEVRRWLLHSGRETGGGAGPSGVGTPNGPGWASFWVDRPRNRERRTDPNLPGSCHEIGRRYQLQRRQGSSKGSLELSISEDYSCQFVEFLEDPLLRYRFYKCRGFSAIYHGNRQSLMKCYCKPLSVKLDEDNYLLWKLQLRSTMYSQDLLRYVDSSSTHPPKKLNSNSTEINPEYIKWKRSDQLALSWILSTVSESILTQMISYDKAREAWVALANAHASHSNIRILQLNRDLQNAKKNDKSMLEYLNHVRFLVDSLSAVNETVSDLDLVLHTPNGLSSEYESFITTVTMSKILPTFSKSHDLLLNQERRLQLLAPKISAQVES